MVRAHLRLGRVQEPHQAPEAEPVRNGRHLVGAGETHAVLACEFPQSGDELDAVAAAREHGRHVRPLEVRQDLYYRPCLVAVGRHHAHEVREACFIAQQVAGRRRADLRDREQTEDVGNHRRRRAAVGADDRNDVVGADWTNDAGAAAGVLAAERQEGQRPGQRYLRRGAVVDRDETEADVRKHFRVGVDAIDDVVERFYVLDDARLAQSAVTLQLTDVRLKQSQIRCVVSL